MSKRTARTLCTGANPLYLPYNRPHLGDEHAVLQLGVGGNLLAQLRVLGHQALAVAAPCAWQPKTYA